VNRILDLLTDHQREIVYLHFIEEMPYEEIAVMLDMKIQTVRGQVFKAMEKLRKLDSDKKIIFCFFLSYTCMAFLSLNN
jgi:DNA-directed RNA polymerase specialized sigma24 family protein